MEPNLLQFLNFLINARGLKQIVRLEWGLQRSVSNLVRMNVCVFAGFPAG